jgi:hypothetical protein
MGLTFALEGMPISGGGMSAKSFLSSLMAVSTRALSRLLSLTYVRREPALRTVAEAAACDNLRNGAVVTEELEPSREADLSAEDVRLAMMPPMMGVMERMAKMTIEVSEADPGLFTRRICRGRRSG